MSTSKLEAIYESEREPVEEYTPERLHDTIDTVDLALRALRDDATSEAERDTLREAVSHLMIVRECLETARAQRGAPR